jgi:uncharacterized delta-60 repeat protein
VAGNFGFVNGVVRTSIAQLNTDGSLDTGFALTGSGFGDSVIACVAVQGDNKYVVVGDFANYNGTSRNGIARLNSDGSLDTSFNPGSGFNYNPSVAIIQLDGKIVVGGGFATYNGTPHVRIVRLNADGTPDNSFNPGTGLDGPPETLAVEAAMVGAKITVGGGFASINGVARAGILRLNADGSLDTSFNPGTGFAFTNVAAGIVEELLVQADGKIITVGDFSSFNGEARAGIARLNTNGTLDTSFNPGNIFPTSPSSLALQTDGKVIVGGIVTSPDTLIRSRIVRLNTDGSTDSNFAASEMVGSGVRLAENGRLLLTGSGAIGPGVVQVGFAALAPDALAPVFTTQPASATVNVGGSATFTAMANGVPAPTYQWYKLTSTPLLGKTDPTLTLTNVQSTDGGLYALYATNSAGYAISDPAVLTVNSSSSSSSSSSSGSSSSSSGGGGGGGGAPSISFLIAILTLASLNRKRLSGV